MGLLALFGWSLAHASGLQEGAVITPSELVPQATPAESTEGLDGVLALAEEMRRTGAPGNCRQLLLTIDGDVGDDHRSDYLFLRGFCAELAWDNEAARDDYREVIARNTSKVDAARSRLALVLEDLGDGHGALQQMVILHRNEGWDLDDQITVNLEKALAEVAAGRRRRGARHVEAALVVAESWKKGSWLSAKARYVLLDVDLRRAEQHVVRGSERHQAAAVTRRVRAFTAAETAMVPLVAHEEPEWILHGLYRLGGAYLAFGEELVAARPPARLTAEQERIYRDQVAAQQQQLRTRAAHVYDQGVQLALRLQFESPLVARLQLERDRLGITQSGSQTPSQ